MQDKQFNEDLNETGRNAEDLQGLLRKSQSGKISGCFTGPLDFIQIYGMQYEFEDSLSEVTLGFFLRKSWQNQ
jgi:hypothetical protein